MNLRIEAYREFNDNIVNDIFKLAKLMEDAGEYKRIVFTIIYFIFTQSKGTF